MRFFAALGMTNQLELIHNGDAQVSIERMWPRASAYLLGRRRNGLHRPRAGGHAATRRIRQRCVDLDSAKRLAAFRAESKKRYMAFHDRRREPSGKLRSEAGSQQICRNIDRGNAIERRTGQEVP